MPLPLTKLLQGGVHATDNWTLQTLFKEVKAYNDMGTSTPSGQRVDKLHLIAHIAGIYVTSKPPQGSAKYKNQLRWDGIQDLLDGVGIEVKAAGARLLTGPSDYRQIDNQHRSYWLEFLDPMHRPGYVLSPKYSAWLKDDFARKTKQSFWTFVGTARFGGDPKANVGYLLERGESAPYRVVFDTQQLLCEDGPLGVAFSYGEPVHTEDQETAFSSTGWAIFVVSPTREMYSSSHIVGKLHHSSFLSGRPVMAAGELVVDGGVIKVVTGKSGHYVPSADDLLRFVRAFPQIPSGAVIRPDMTDEANHGQANFHTVGDFRLNGLGAALLTRDEVLASVPHWARNGESNKVFDKVPRISGKRMLRKLGKQV
ncbi:MAG: hypothetical protein U1F56_18890 [Rubrivivax sp.]